MALFMGAVPLQIDLHEIEKRYRKRLTDPYDIKRSNLGTFLDDNLEYLAECRKSDGAPPPFGLDYEPIWTWDLPKAKQSLESVHSG
ncbi:Hypothetical protein NTJ_02479 [Nesidiocoris tenuis]|uniref:Uncharacterized protein n=1 Tax=Nesidiocoris tenuis TaxID=355587 RepID=A0ABN7AEJ3_9HEMI|nr:Hypothetical protein NTJ_02479 [Nesidiocoris tenuis]